MRFGTLMLCAALPLVAGSALAADAESLAGEFSARVEALRDDLIAVRRDIHRHAEPSGEEVRTAGIVAARLEALGYDVRRNVGGHGVVGYLEGARPGRVVAFRADMDATLTDAPDPVEFRSERAGVRHICGHDIHTTVGLAIAEGFAAISDEANGALLLIFQPAEESATGAKAMIEDGAMDNPAPEAIFAVHTAPFEVGELGVAEAVMMAARDRLIVNIQGERAGEAAKALVTDLAAIGTVKSGFEPQPLASDFVFADVWLPKSDNGDVSVRAIYTMTTEVARKRVRAAAELALAKAMVAYDGIAMDSDYEAKWIPGVTNDPALVRRASTSIKVSLGDNAVIPIETTPAAVSEDFGHMQNEAPGAYFYLGVSNAAKGTVGMPHSPDYIADEEAIFVGAKAMGRVIVDHLAAN